MRSFPCGAAVIAALLGACGAPGDHAIDGGEPALPVSATLAEAGAQALQTLELEFYDQHGGWNLCNPPSCGATDGDWGADVLTSTLYLAWSITHDPGVAPTMAALDADGPSYSPCLFPACATWSDEALWDSVAASRQYEVLGSASALARAVSSFDYVDGGDAFALGACPTIDYQVPQLPGGGSNNLKTLETDSNYIKAALLLHHSTGVSSYLTRAAAKYAAVRDHFLDPTLPLYSVYVFDDGTRCAQVPQRFFGGVNGNMIWSGYHLWLATGDPSYHAHALATAGAVADSLGDAAGVYANLQAENDVVEPLIEAMYELATSDQQAFASTWILLNAAASASARTPDGAYRRFFDGPGLPGTVTAWQSNGGLALALAAAALDPSRPIAADRWAPASYVAQDISTLPSTLAFHGSAIALIGTIGEQCCGGGHASVFVDGVETIDRTGIWQNKSSSGHALPDSILFAWRWPQSGEHRLDFAGGDENAKEGGPFLHVRGYYLLP
jgi:hypothetical protein